MVTLWDLKNRREAVDDVLVHAHAQARLLNLPGTQAEIEAARSRIDGIIFEIEQKRVPELASLKD